MLSQLNAKLRLPRGWLTLSCSVLPFLLVLAGMELFKIATFPHLSFLREKGDSPAGSNKLLLAQDGSKYEVPGNRWDVMDCLNQHQESYYPTTWASAMSHRPASLMVVGIWWSTKPASVPLTITTQMSAARLWQLRALCMQYPGPVSAVLYVGLLRGRVLREDGLLAFMVRQADALFHAMERSGRCKLDLMLVREVFDDADAKIWYPVNQLRNYARIQARTPLIAIVDADLLVSSVLVDELQQPAMQQHYVQQLAEKKDKAVYVLPAFQVPNGVPRKEAMGLADRAVILPKDRLQDWFQKQYVVPFDPGKPGHAATNYTKWFSTTKPYEVNYELRYEPWVLCDRRSIPWHDNTFKGYGLNKIMHLEHMSSLGYRFVVHPSAFLVHRAHRSTKAKKLVLTAKQAQKLMALPPQLAEQPHLVAQPEVPEEAQEEGHAELEEEADEEQQTKGQVGEFEILLRRLMGFDQGIAGAKWQEGMSIERGQERGEIVQSAEPLDDGVQADYVGREHSSAGELEDVMSEEDEEEAWDTGWEESMLHHGGWQRLLLGDAAVKIAAVRTARVLHKVAHHNGVSTYSHTQKLGDEARAKIAAGAYEPRTDNALHACLKRLEWWQ